MTNEEDIDRSKLNKDMDHLKKLEKRMTELRPGWEKLYEKTNTN